AQIKREMVRLRTQGGADDDPVTRLTGTLSGLGRELESIRDSIRDSIRESVDAATKPEPLGPTLARLGDALDKLAQPKDLTAALRPTLDALRDTLARLQSPKVEVKLERVGSDGEDAALVAARLATQAEALERRIAPLVESTSRNVEDTRALHEHIIQLFDLVRRMDAKLRETYGV
ncbi:MAG: hypothetical protein MUE69_29320, partial [Myxococcota bacterium]|nr:hypothetical protein [Myxococcota bacterium]